MERVLAISPLDGRYADKVSQLNNIASEFGLVKYRVKVEIEWLKLLFATPGMNLPDLSAAEIKILDGIADNFDINACNRIKSIEKTTNHDVKAVEYYIKEQIAGHTRLNQYREYIHFACTSEDINNLSYALMLKDIRDQVLIPELNKIQSKLYDLGQQYKHVAMMCRTHGQSATPSTMGKEI